MGRRGRGPSFAQTEPAMQKRAPWESVGNLGGPTLRESVFKLLAIKQEVRNVFGRDLTVAEDAVGMTFSVRRKVEGHYREEKCSVTVGYERGKGAVIRLIRPTTIATAHDLMSGNLGLQEFLERTIGEINGKKEQN